MNDPDPAVSEALRWLRFSEEDIEVALRLLTGSPSAPRHACWLSQQAAEKAHLMLEDIKFPFPQGLDALSNILLNGWPVRDTQADLAELTEWTMETTDPGDRPDPNARGIRGPLGPRLHSGGITAARCARQVGP